MLESLLIVLALAWTAAYSAGLVSACAAPEAEASIRRGGAGEPLSILLAGLLRSKFGWQWFALGAAGTRAAAALAPAWIPVATWRLAVLRPAVPRSALCDAPRPVRCGPPVAYRFNHARLTSD